MKTRLLTIVFISIHLLISLTGKAQNYMWAKGVGGSGTDEGMSVVTDASGNVYSSGTFSGTVDFDPSLAVYNLTSTGNLDAFITKLDASGNFVWARSFGGTASEYMNSITLDASGNVYAVGTFSGATDFDPGTGTYTLTSGAYSDAFILKLDGSGSFLWAKNLIGPIGTWASSISADLSGNIYVTGYFRSSVDFDPGAGTFSLTSMGSEETYILKLNSSGVFVWAKSIDNTGSSFGRGITTDVSGNVYLTGSYTGTVDLDPGASTYTFASVNGTDDFFILKLDATGNYIWAKNFGGTSWDYGFSIKTDLTGNVFVTGYFNNTIDFDPGAGVYNLTANAFGDGIFILALNSSGNFFWAKTILGSSTGNARSIFSDASGNIYITGTFGGSADFDPGTGTFILTATGSMDVCILKLDGSGNFVWAKNVGGTGADIGNSINVDAAGNVFVAGSFSTTVDFDPGPGISSLTSSGDTDAFVLKLCNLTITSVASSSLICSGKNTTVTANGGITYTWNPGGATTSSIVISPATTTNYTLGGTNSAGCTALAYQTISVNPLPNVAISTTGSIICMGNTATLTASGAGTYTWSNTATATNIAVSPVSTTNYTVTGTNLTTACTNTAVQTISVNALPTVTTNATSTVICFGNTTTLTASGATTYSWSTSALTTSISVSPVINTSYTVTGTDAVTSCSNTAIQTISVNALPTVTTNATSTVICLGNTTTITASGASTYTWDNAATTSSISVGPIANTSYTVTGTDALTSCTNSAVETISVNALPTVTASATSTLICSGQTTTLTASGGSTYAWDNAATTISISVNPVSNTTYTVIGTDAVTSCTNMAIESISVNASPTVTLSTSATSLCAGLVATLTPGGANTYTLNPGNTSGTSFTVSPVAATQYTLTGTNLVNCSGSTIQAITVNALTNISGAVTSTAGTVNGVVILYQYTSFLSKWDSVSFSPINASSYSFLSVPGASYVVRAMPTQTNLLETYGTVSSSWQGATTIDHDCIANSIQNINVLALTNIGSGQGSLSGKITEGQGYGQKTSQVTTPGTPIGGVIVKGGTNPGGNIMGKTTTNSSGQYTLGNLPATGPGESYYLLVDIPGLDTNKTYHRIMFTGLENYTQLDFIVDSVQINPVDLTVGISELKTENTKFSFYPNPAKDRITIVCELKKSSVVSIELTDLSGRILQTLLSSSEQSAGELKIIAGLNNEVKAGVYFVRIKVEKEEKITKFIIAD